MLQAVPAKAPHSCCMWGIDIYGTREGGRQRRLDKKLLSPSTLVMIGYSGLDCALVSEQVGEEV